MLRRTLPAALAALSLVLAAPPAYPEPAVGGGYLHPGHALLVAQTPLPYQPAGMDSGASLYLAAGDDAARGALELGVLVFPGLTLGESYLDAGGFARVSAYRGDKGEMGLGLWLGPRVSLEYPDPPVTLTLGVGLGYYGGLYLGYGLGLRAYLEPAAVELGWDSDTGPYGALLFLW